MDLIKGIFNFIGFAILTVIGIAVLFAFGWASGSSKLVADAGLSLGPWEGYGVVALVSFLSIYIAIKLLIVIDDATGCMHGNLWGWLGAFFVMFVMFGPIIYLFFGPSTPVAS